MTPTQRSLKKLREEGYRVAIVEHWNSFARIRQDLFGIIDLVALKPGETKGVQTTSLSNISSRINKVKESEALDWLREAGWTVEIHGWDGTRCRVENIS